MSEQYFVKSKPKVTIAKVPKLGMEKKHVGSAFRQHYNHTLGRDKTCRTPYYAYEALSMAVRDRLVERWQKTTDTYKTENCKRAFYLSLEFLMGRSLSNAMLNLGLTEEASQAMYDLGLDIEELIDAEADAGLGNGGLGRLAACFIDSCATLQLPVLGYGLRYEYGMFSQSIANGDQIEKPDHWLRNGNVWEIKRPERTRTIKFGGRTETNDAGVSLWLDTDDVLAVPYDIPVPGYQNNTVNTLRLWKATATEEFNLQDFNAGSYPEAVAAKNRAEDITMVLYPNDANENGKELRLRQQYFLASASLQDAMTIWTDAHGNDFSQFSENNCFQLNDTHPSIAVAELMRLLIDEQGIAWDDAWAIITKTMAYTNHTLLPEALEKWSVNLFENLLPRLLEIIYLINENFLKQVAEQWPDDSKRIQRMSLIEEGYGNKQVCMAYLAIVGSFSVNGVAKLHSQLLKEGLFKDFYELWPEKFNNKTNGITPRRWLAVCNPELAALITATIGDEWIYDLEHLQKLAPYAKDEKFRNRWIAIKQNNKQRLIDYCQQNLDVAISADALFDIQVKRIHEYKRQLLNVLHVIHLYNRIKRGDTENWTNRFVLIGGKAAPGYVMAKQIIKLINNVADIVNSDTDVGDKLKLVFTPNYRVSAMEIICPAAELSEQISTAGKEASGTGNMKFMMNAALTIGTLDGANVEIREEVGDDNFFLFGLNEPEVKALRSHYDPVAIIKQDADLKQVMDRLESGYFNASEWDIFDDIINALKNTHDQWMTIADFRSFIDAQEAVSVAYKDKKHWAEMSILNCAKSGKFSTDRTIGDYNQGIWKLDPVAIGE